MEYIPFGDLENYMSNNGAMPEADAQQVSFQILEGLSYMHREGFAHRDVKPGVSFSSFHL
jgi:serine/threonine protein kinase